MNPIKDAFIDKSLGRLNIIKENYDLMALREIIMALREIFSGLTLNPHYSS